MLIGSDRADPPDTTAGTDVPDAAPTGAAVESTTVAAAFPEGHPSATSSPAAGAVLVPSRRWRTVAVGVVVVAALAVVLITLVAARDRINADNALNSARTTALSAARAYSVEVASYDYHHLAEDFQQVEQHSTPAFRATFSQSSQTLNSVLTRYGAIASARVLAVGLESASTSRAVADVFIDQTVTNTTQKAPTTDQSRVEITLVRLHGRWLIDQLKLL